MGARTKARKRALDILFESELRGLDTGATLADRRETVDALNSYTVTLVEGVVAHRVEIDALLSEHSEGWPLERMPGVDRNLLRIGVFELRYVDDVPDAVVMSEAVSLARELSTDESPAFVNGLLAKIAGLPSVSAHEPAAVDGEVGPPTPTDQQPTSRITPGLGADRDAARPS